MAVKTYNKLVRDRIIEVIESKGGMAIYSVLDENEYVVELNKKLFEECRELTEACNLDDIKEEISDVLEVVYAMAKLHNIDSTEIEKIRVAKMAKKGAFEKRLFLQTVEEL